MSNIRKLILLILTFSIILITSCSKDNRVTDDSIPDSSNDIIVYVDKDIDEGTKTWLYSLKEDFPNYNLKFVTNVVSNKKYFLDSMIENNFTSDIVISKYLTKENSTNLANLSGKSFFPKSSFNSLKKMDQDGNIYLIPFTDTKKYLLVNKTFFLNQGLEVPKNGESLIKYLYLLKDYPTSLYINYETGTLNGAELFNYAFSLTDGLTIKGYKWANDLENGLADVSSFDFSRTFDFLDYFKNADINQIKSNREFLDEALEKFNNNEIGIFEISTNDIEQIKPYFSDNILAIPYYSPLDGKNYVMSESQVYIGVNKNSMDTKKDMLNDFLSKILGNVGEIEVLFEENNIYAPLIGLSSSVYDTYYKSINSYEKNNIATLYNFERGKEYLSTAVEQYVTNEISRDEFINYWQQDVLVSKFELNKVALATTETDLNPKDCSMLIAKAIYDQVDCDISVVTVSELTHDFDNLDKMYSSSPYFIKKGEIYWEDIYNLAPLNQNIADADSKSQKLLYSVFTGKELISLLEDYSSQIVYYGIRKINDDYYTIKKNGSIEKIILDGYYNLITNSNFSLDGFSLPNPIIYNKTVIDCLSKWIIENNEISNQSVFTYNIVAN